MSETTLIIPGFCSPRFEWRASPIPHHVPNPRVVKLPVAGTIGLATNRRAVQAAINDAPGDVHLVGHSLGGLLATMVQSTKIVSICALGAPLKGSPLAMTKFLPGMARHFWRSDSALGYINPCAPMRTIAGSWDFLVPPHCASHDAEASHIIVPCTHLSMVFSLDVALWIAEWIS